MRHEAIYLLYPAVKKIGDNAGAFDANNQKVEIDESLVQAKIAELAAAEPMRLLRVERDRLIALTDWRFRSDLTPSQAWIDYCQALRDLPANSTPALDENGQLTGVNWPTPPES
jgi:hypothetical protein